MTRAFVFLAVAMTLLTGVSPARAQAGFGGFFGGGSNFGGNSNYYGGGSSPIVRTLVSSPGRFAPGTIYINTAERRGDFRTVRLKKPRCLQRWQQCGANPLTKGSRDD